MKCKYCDVIKGKRKRKGGIIYENKRVIVFLGSQHHKGHTTVVLRNHKEDLLNLTPEENECFYNCTLRIAKAVKVAMKPDKMNYALFGNWVEHLHWHIYPRYKTDSDWGNPPTFGKKVLHTDEKMQKIAKRIKEHIPDYPMCAACKREKRKTN